MSTMSIGQLSQQTGVAIDTIRYYERNALLKPAGRLASGYRRYGDHEMKRLVFIRRAKSLGFSLDDIRVLLHLSDERNVGKIRRTAQSKLDDIDRRIAELQRVRAGLGQLIEACPGHGRAEACPILNALGEAAP
jgi:MerR family copper efflux transcriptional regulator